MDSSQWCYYLGVGEIIEKEKKETMSNKENSTTPNEPAMPVRVLVDDNFFSSTYAVHLGLSKREHFAGLAMQGLLSSVDIKDFESKELVTASVRIADEMINELNKDK